MEKPIASIIIPNLNGRSHLFDCLTSLREQTFANFELLLVDNGSTDGSQEYVRQNFPEATLIELGSNQGFTGACNAGYFASQGEIVILLNNDTEVEPSWLQTIVTAFEQQPDVGAVASKMLLFDDRQRLHTAGDYVRLDGIPGNRGAWQEDNGRFSTPEYVFSACGGSSAYRRTMLDQIGFLDDAYFFSCEDVDLGWRAQLAGWHVLYVPEAIVYHKLKASGGGVTASYYDGRNFLYLLWKNYPTSLLRHHWLAVLRGQLRITATALRHWRGAEARARLRGQLAGLLSFFKMLPRRRHVQSLRKVDDTWLLAILSPVDDHPPSG